MEKFVSSFSNLKSVPESYIFPAGERPGDEVVPTSNSIPVIDLQGPNARDQILIASEEFGFFQVINHGIPDGLVIGMMSIFNELFEMPEADKAEINSKDLDGVCRLFTSSVNYSQESVHFWRDVLRHPCHPLEEYIQFWPQKPSTYRQVVGDGSTEVRKLALRILEMVSEGLGLEAGYFSAELTNMVNLSVNHYPPCPEPSLSLGLSKHSDPNLVTILHQGGVYGLQVFKDGKWIAVEPIPNAFVVNIGYQLQIISNGKLKSAEHRAVTHATQSRTSAVFFIGAQGESIIEPAKDLVNEQNPALYKGFQFKEFLAHYYSVRGDVEATLKPYIIHA